MKYIIASNSSNKNDFFPILKWWLAVTLNSQLKLLTRKKKKSQLLLVDQIYFDNSTL